MNERRIARLQEQIKQRAAQVVAYELNDPALGMITITRVELDKELMSAKIFWSTLGDETQRAKQSRILKKASGFVQTEVAKVLSTRTVPRVSFHFDERIEGAIRMQGILDGLRAEREARESARDDADDRPRPDFEDEPARRSPDDPTT